MDRRWFMKFAGMAGVGAAAGKLVTTPQQEEPLYFKGESPEEKAAEASMKHHASAGGTIAMFVSTA
jgi:hypothetical protein